MKKRKNMKNLNGYWVNKKSGTIHYVLQDTDWSGNPTLWANSRNLRYERSYHFRGDAVQRFQKKYDFICDNQQMSFMLMFWLIQDSKMITLGVEKPMVGLVSLRMNFSTK